MAINRSILLQMIRNCDQSIGNLTEMPKMWSKVAKNILEAKICPLIYMLYFPHGIPNIFGSGLLRVNKWYTKKLFSC